MKTDRSSGKPSGVLRAGDRLGVMTDGLEERLFALYDEPDGRFHVLARAACLDPKQDFQNRDLRALSFLDADLRGFNFANSDLRGTRLRTSTVDTSTNLEGAIVDQLDSLWLEAQQMRRTSLDAALFEDLQRGALSQMELVYQPILELKDGAIRRAEALTRWHHPEHGHIPPAVFVPMIDEAGLAEAHAYYIIESVNAAQRHIRTAGYEILISLNIPGRVLHDREFVDNCVRLLEGQRCRLRFEIPETSLLFDTDQLALIVERLAAVGVDIAIDDYGTSYSSLVGMRSVPAVEMKIDRSLIASLKNDERDSGILRSTIDLGHALGMTVTAEGVELDAEVNVLRVMGCDAVQGYIINRPVPLDKFIELLDSIDSLTNETKVTKMSELGRQTGATRKPAGK